MGSGRDRAGSGSAFLGEEACKPYTAVLTSPVAAQPRPQGAFIWERSVYYLSPSFFLDHVRELDNIAEPGNDQDPGFRGHAQHYPSPGTLSMIGFQRGFGRTAASARLGETR